MESSTVEVKLEIAPVEATVNVGGAVTANTDAIYQQLRQAGNSDGDFTSFATVNNLVMERDAAVFTLKQRRDLFRRAG